MKCRIYFADEQVQGAFMALKASRDPGDQRLAGLLDQALDRISADAFCGIQVPKKLIPKDYHKRHGPLENLWKYNLTRSWRLMYTVASDGDTIAVFIEWLDHTDYNRRFGY